MQKSMALLARGISQPDSLSSAEREELQHVVRTALSNENKDTPEPESDAKVPMQTCNDTSPAAEASDCASVPRGEAEGDQDEHDEVDEHGAAGDAVSSPATCSSSDQE